MTLLDAVARWLVTDFGGPLPEGIQWHGKAHLLDSVGMMLAGREHALTARAAATFPASGDAEAIAYSGGVACDALGLDDFDELTRIHPGAVVVPAMIGTVAASPSAVSGADLLTGVVAGYELTCRFGELAHAWTLHDRGWHPTGICGAVGAAAGVALTRGADAAAAVGLAASLASGVFELDGMGAIKGLQTGWAARSAVTAATMAAVGYRPAPTVLDGRKGLLAALGCAAPSDDEIAVAFNGSPRLERISFKPYSHFTDLHPATSALLDLLRDEPVDVDDIAAIEVQLPAGTVGRLNTDFPPPSPRLARRCPRFALAAVACRADATVVADPLIAAFDGSGLDDARILELGRRVQWADDLPQGAIHPCAIVTMRLRDGGVRTASADGYPGDGRLARHRWGWVPVSDRYQLVAPADAHGLIDAVAVIEAVADARPLARRIAAWGRSVPQEREPIL